MNILIYTHSWFPLITGVTVRYKQIIDHLKKNNNIILINPYSDEKYDGITVIKIEGQSIPDCLNDNDKRDVRIADMSSYMSLFISINKICKDYNIDVIHCGGPDPMQILLKFVTVYNNIPYVIMLHTNLSKYGKAKYINISLQKVVNSFVPDLYILPSKTYYNELINDNLINADHSYFIMPQCVDHKIFYKTDPTKIHFWTQGKIRLLYVGRVENEKNIDDVLNSMDASMCLCIIGKGKHVGRLNKLSIELNLDVKFIGQVDSNELRYWYSSCDIFIMTSKTETLGFVTLEAMACGAPICAYRGSGTIDIITHRYNGLLYKNNKILMKYIKLLMTDSELKQKIINNGLEYISEKTIKKSVNTLYSQYKNIVRSPFR